MAPRHRTSAGSCLSLPRGSPEALPPLPADSQLQEHGCFLCRRCRISLPAFPISLLARAGAAVGREPPAEQGPPGSLPAIRGSAPSPECVGGSGRSLTPVRPGRAHPRCCGPAAGTGRAGGGTWNEAEGREAMWMWIPGADAATFPDSWGAAGGSALPDASAALLCTSLQCAMSKGSQRNPRWEGWRRGVLETPCPGCLPAGPKRQGSLPALQPPQCPPLPSLSSARGGVVALSSHPKLTVNFPNKGQFLHIQQKKKKKTHTKRSM